MTILITGVAGLIGSSLAHWIIDNTEHKVIGVDNLSGGFRENAPKSDDRFTFLNADILDRRYIDSIFESNKPDIVYHTAAYAAECLSPFIRCFNYEQNVVGSASIINGSIKHKVKRLVFTSSMAVYGDQKPPFDEYYIPKPCDPYGIAKAAVEADIQIAGNEQNLDWCIIRPHNVVGIRQNIFDPYRNFVGIAIYKGLIGDPITVYGDGEQKRAFTEIRDILEPLYIAGTSEKCSKQIINLGGVHEYSINEIANIVSRLSGSAIIHLPPRNEVKNAFATWKKSEVLLGFKHQTSITKTIEDMWEWAKSLDKRERQVWGEYELEDSIYPYWKKEALKDGFYKR